MAWKLKALFSRKPESAQPDAETWFQQGNAHVSERQWLPALDCYRGAARLDPNRADIETYIGNVLRQLRRADEALVAYDRAIAIKPDYAEAHYNRGSLLQQAGQARAALESYEVALSINPAFIEAHCNRGDALKALDRQDEALASYNTAIAINGGFSRAYVQRGILQQQLHQLDAAEASYRRAIALAPNYADAHVNLGSLQSDKGDTRAALTSFEGAIALNPSHGGAHAGRGLALLVLGQPDAALASFDIASKLRPDLARIFSGRALAQAKLGLLAEARSSHDQAIVLDPRDAVIHFNRGSFLSDLEEWSDAIESYRTAIALDPAYADAYCNLGHAQQEAGQGDAALDSYSHALEINPGLSTVFNNRANLLRSRHQLAEALLDYRRAVVLEPNAAEVHYNIAQLALLQGDFEGGWPEYEWRGLTKDALAVPARQSPRPAWFGDHPLKGKQILLYAEQGLGDTIQFCRYARLVAELGARVTLEVQPPLFDLLKNLDGVSHLVLPGDPVPAADYQCSIMSLPGAFSTTLETIPSNVPYLRADPDKVARWTEILGPRTRPRVGLAWSGNPHNGTNRKRSVELARWIPLLPDECEYFCLPKGINDADRRIMNSCGKFISVESHNENFTDTAALIEVLDLVVTVDTSLAHLSGAMGKTTWILLCHLPDWRWLLDRRDTPWYPTATLYRQPVAGDWHSVMAEVHKNLLLRCL